MSVVTAEMVKTLRERTGVGMAKCKEALQAASGDMEKAIADLRKAGIASAVKKEGRETKEGTIIAHDGDKIVAIVEVNTETDFVAKNDRFLAFARALAAQVAATMPASVDQLLTAPFKSGAPSMGHAHPIADEASSAHSMGSGNRAPSTDHAHHALTGTVSEDHTVDQERAGIVQTLGENIKIARLAVIPKGPDVSIAMYSHMGGRIVTLVVLQGASDQQALAKEIAMHTAAEAPQWLKPEEIPANLKAQEEEIARAQVKGKPDNIVGKIVEGKLNAFYDQNCLLKQKFIKDSSMSIEQLVERKAKEIGKPLQVVRFLRWQVGQA